jgi:hypothetical protein
MSAGNAFSVEDFLDAITTQLDRSQDALRLKSVTRPLTYAIRDFSMELKVVVEMAADGQVLFRAAAPQDTGASVVHIGFTTVNRTMIDENTVSLSSVRSPSLDDLGLDADEKRKLERLGIRSSAQLEQLKRTTGESTVARYSGMPVSRLRQAMSQARPSVDVVRPARPPVEARVAVSDPDGETPVLRLPAGTRRVFVGGPRLEDAAGGARFGGRQLSVEPVRGGVEVDLGDDAQDGPLHLDLGEDGVVALALAFDPAPSGLPTPPAPDDAYDPWSRS